jgi:hypothetical protein
MVADMASELVASGERSVDCKTPLNAWMLCLVVRDNKRILLDKATKPTEDEKKEEEEEEEEEADEEAEEDEDA